MHAVILLSVAILISIGIMVIGCIWIGGVDPDAHDR